jgi:hypothetical protein
LVTPQAVSDRIQAAEKAAEGVEALAKPAFEFIWTQAWGLPARAGPARTILRSLD